MVDDFDAKSRRPWNLKSSGAPYWDTQAVRVASRFGNTPYDLLRALQNINVKRDPANVYRWVWEPAESQGMGIIPKHALIEILRAARYEGIQFSSSDLDPRPRLVKPAGSLTDDGNLIVPNWEDLL